MLDVLPDQVSQNYSKITSTITTFYFLRLRNNNRAFLLKNALQVCKFLSKNDKLYLNVFFWISFNASISIKSIWKRHVFLTCLCLFLFSVIFRRLRLFLNLLPSSPTTFRSSAVTPCHAIPFHRCTTSTFYMWECVCFHFKYKIIRARFNSIY